MSVVIFSFLRQPSRPQQHNNNNSNSNDELLFGRARIHPIHIARGLHRDDSCHLLVEYPFSPPDLSGGHCQGTGTIIGRGSTTGGIPGRVRTTDTGPDEAGVAVGKCDGRIHFQLHDQRVQCHPDHTVGHGHGAGFAGESKFGAGGRIRGHVHRARHTGQRVSSQSALASHAPSDRTAEDHGRTVDDAIVRDD